MRKPQILASLGAAVALGLVGLVGAATPAGAATTLTLSNCQAALNGQTLTIPTGETNYNVAFSSGGCTVNLSTGSTPALAISTSPNPTASDDTIVFTGQLFLTVQTSTGSGIIAGSKLGGGAITGGPFLIYYSYIPALGSTVSGSFTMVVGSGGGGGSSSNSSSAPAPVIQQFGMPATGTCDDAQPEGLNLAGVPSGGWGESWAQWMNGGIGGAVCTRTLNYSTVQSKWVVN